MEQVELSAALRTLVERLGASLFTIPGEEVLPPVQGGDVCLIAHPGDTETVAEIMRAAHQLGLKVAPRGSGTKLDRGNPAVRVDVVLDLSGLNRIIEHAAGDLTVSVEAGVHLDHLAEELARARQFLALDPPIRGTVGGLISTGDSGPRRVRYGGVRDQVLGVRFVRADGVIARGGGKVVKNVAGYDLPKLFTGALGTLGVITEAVFRLYSMPATSSTVVVANCSSREAGAMATLIVASPLVPTMLDFVEGESGSRFAVRFEGPERSTREQSERVIAMLGKGEIFAGASEEELWELCDEVLDSSVLARLIAPRESMGALLDEVRLVSTLLGLPVKMRGHMGHGHALLGWLDMDGDVRADVLADMILSMRKRAEREGGNLVLWRGPELIRNRVETWGDVGEGLGLMRRIKAEFDPQNTLNPGRFAGGI